MYIFNGELYIVVIVYLLLGECMEKKERKQRKKALIPEKESNEERFIRVVTPRVNKTLDDLRKIKNVIKSNRYTMTEEHINKITEMLTASVYELNVAFNSRNKKKDELKPFSFFTE